MVSEIRLRAADGTPILLRRLVPTDEPALREAIESFSPQTRYMRFFSGAPHVPEHVIHRLADADGILHVAWVAIDESAPDHQVIGAVHAMRDDPKSPTADFAIGLIDPWHSRGISRLLIALLASEARQVGITRLTADVLYENKAGRALMKSIGAVSGATGGTSIHYNIELEATLSKLDAQKASAPMQSVFKAIDTGAAMPAAA